MAAASGSMVGHRATAVEDVTLGDEADQGERAKSRLMIGHFTVSTMPQPGPELAFLGGGLLPDRRLPAAATR
jgi:hypothetical protein